MSWKSKFVELTAKTHTEQAHWFLNGYWTQGASDYAEDVWEITHKFIETQIDGPVLHGSKSQKIEEDCDLDEMKSHRVLELMGETLTVVELRKRLKELDIDQNTRMSLSEYLLDKYKKTPDELVNSPQGEIDPVELAKLTEACDNASRLLEEASAEAAASKKAAAAAAKAKVEADEAQASAKAAEAELQVVVDEIVALEKTKADKVAALQAKIDDPNTSTVKRGGAVQEKEQLLGEDPLPLRKAKITQSAALKRVTKARKLADEAAASAESAKKAADQAEVDASAAKVAAEQGYAAALEALNDLKTKGSGSPQGKLWWMERTLTEKKKFSKN